MYFAVLSPKIQSELAKRALVELKKQFGTDITLDSARINYFGKIYLYGVKAKDHKGEKFISIGSIVAKLSPVIIYNNPSLLELNKLELINPVFRVKTYKGDTIDNFALFISKFNKKEKKKDSKFSIKGNVIIVNGVVSIYNRNIKPQKQEWLNATDVNGEIKNLVLEKDNTRADIRGLRFYAERNDVKYRLIDFSTKLKILKKLMYFDDLTLHTSNSNLKGFLHFDYNNIKAFKNFNYAVNVDLKLKEKSTLSYKDLQYFIENWDSNDLLNLSGNAKGTISNFALIDFSLDDGRNKLKVKKMDLKNINAFSLGYFVKADKLDFTSSYSAIKQILPSSISRKIPKLLGGYGELKYKGDLLLKNGYVFATGILNSGVGNMEFGKFSINNYQDPNKIKYIGTIKTNNLDIEKLTGVKKIGLLTVDLFVNGKGIKKDAVIYTRGSIKEINLFGKNLQNIELDGNLANRLFDGKVEINDEKIAGNYNGVFDFSKDIINLKFISKIYNINFKSLGLMDENVNVSANVIGDFSFSNLNNFIGEVKLTDVKFERNKKVFKYKEINLASSITADSQKKYTVEVPNVLRGNIQGDFDVKTAPQLFIESFNKIFIKDEPFSTQKNELVLFDFKVQNNFFKMFYPKVDIGNENLFLKGNISTIQDNVYLNLNVNELKYENSIFSGANILIDNKQKENPFIVRLEKAQIGKVLVKNILIETQNPEKDTLQVKSSFVIGEKNPSSFVLNLYQTKKNNLIKVGFNESEVTINDKLWKILSSKEGLENLLEINTKDKTYAFYNINLVRENQKLNINANYLNDKDYYLNIDLSKVKLEEAIPKELLGNTKLSGVVNGSLDVVKTPLDLLPVIKTNIENFKINDQLLGNVEFNSKYNIKDNVFDSNISLLDKFGNKSLVLDGIVDNNGQKAVVKSKIILNDLDMAFVGAFLKDIMSEYTGKLNGEIKIEGSVDDIKYGGTLTATGMGFKVNYLGTKYFFKDENEIVVANDMLEIKKMKFTDVKENTEGYVSGFIFFEKLKNILIDLYFNSNNLLVMDTSIEDNDAFYGNLYLNGDVIINGLTSDLSIKAKGKVTNNSEFSINLGKTEIATENKLVYFVPSLEKYMQTGDMGNNNQTIDKQKGNVTLDFTIDIQPDSKVNIIFDEKQGDQLQASGIAENLRFQRSKTGKMELNGIYELTNGIYRFRRVLNKDFLLNKGSSISWTGDIYKANLNLEAVYSKVVSNVGEYLGSQITQSINTDLVLNITDQLYQPNISFEIKTPEAPLQIQQELETRLANADELKIQFGAILATGKFIPSTGATTQGLTSSAYEVGLKQIGDIISSINQNVNVNFEYTQGDILAATSSDNFRTSVNLKISNRLNLKTAVGINFNNNNIINNNNNNNNFSGQFDLELDITKANNGNFLLRTFSKPTYFGIENYNTTSGSENNNTTINFSQSYGGGIVYRRSYDKFKELFSGQ